MYTCAQCAVQACSQPGAAQLPKNCPMQNPALRNCLPEYSQPENQAFYIASSVLEAEGYGQWPRVREVVEFCKRMGYTKVGLAFCRGLREEARIMDNILRSHGFEVVSVICKTGGVDKEAAGLAPDQKVRPGQFEPMCNPVAQAQLLNQQHTQFNIALGLCVGHDSLFYKYSQALVTTLVAKDRVLAHNPVGALYCANGYFKNKL